MNRLQQVVAEALGAWGTTQEAPKYTTPYKPGVDVFVPSSPRVQSCPPGQVWGPLCKVPCNSGANGEILCPPSRQGCVSTSRRGVPNCPTTSPQWTPRCPTGYKEVPHAPGQPMKCVPMHTVPPGNYMTAVQQPAVYRQTLYGC